MQIVKRTSTEVEINLIGVLRLLIKKVWIPILCSVVLGALFFGLATHFIMPRYTARVTLYVNNSVSSDPSTSITTSDLTASAKLVDTYAAIISSDSVLSAVAEKMTSSMAAEQLRSMISISSVNNTEVFQVSVVDTVPERSAEIANVIAEVFPEKISEIVEGSSTKVIDYAQIPTQISSPNYGRYAQMGVLIGFVGAALFILIWEICDNRIKEEEDLKNWDIPVLGIIPEFSSANKSRGYAYEYRMGGSGKK